MASYTLILVNLFLHDTGLSRHFTFTFAFSGLPMAAFPLHYLYVRHLIYCTAPFQKKEVLHFIPFVLFEIILFVSALFSLVDFSSAAIENPLEMPMLFRVYNVLLLIQGLIYIALSIKMINRYNAHLKDVVSSFEKIQMTWLRNISLTGLAALFVFFIEVISSAYGINISNFIISSSCFAVYVYGMGYVGLLKSEIFASPQIEQTIHQITEIEQQEEQETRLKYEKSGLTEETAQQYVVHLLKLMEEKKPYTDASLTLAQLAEMLSITPHNLS